MTALLLGATGLVGGHVLGLLAHDTRWDRVVTLGRRPLASASATHTHHVLDFDRMAEHAELFQADDVFCCLGTTIRQAGSRPAFRRVDLGYVAVSAALARQNGARQYLLVSALGADEASAVFYNRVKGEAEAAVQQAGYPSVHVFRPSLLVGERDEARVGEKVAELALGALRPLLVGPLRPLRPTPAALVARAMVDEAAAHRPGVHVHEAPDLLARYEA